MNTYNLRWMVFFFFSQLLTSFWSVLSRAVDDCTGYRSLVCRRLCGNVKQIDFAGSNFFSLMGNRWLTRGNSKLERKTKKTYSGNLLLWLVFKSFSSPVSLPTNHLSPSASKCFYFRGHRLMQVVGWQVVIGVEERDNFFYPMHKMLEEGETHELWVFRDNEEPGEPVDTGEWRGQV